MIRRNPSGHLPVIHDTAFVDPTAILCGKIIVEENVFIGPYAVIRADEVDDNGEMEPIVIGAHAWIAAEAFIGPGVTVSEGAVVGARAVLFRDAEPWGVYVGNPARWIKTRVLRQPAPHQAQVIGA